MNLRAEGQIKLQGQTRGFSGGRTVCEIGLQISHLIKADAKKVEVECQPSFYASGMKITDLLRRGRQTNKGP